jgi:hypothetical protein
MIDYADLRRARAALTQGESRQTGEAGWQDIATAPKNGTWMLACWAGEEISSVPVFGVVMWDGDQWREADDIVSEPTLWQPLPAAPTPAGGGGE